MEGFPRCGNTFAVLAFQQAQAEPVAIAHHLHHPAQALRGVAQGAPTVVLIRQPQAAIRSLALRRAEVSVRSLIQQYIDFYTALDSVRDGYLLADFEQITSDFGAVTRRINARFGTAYGCFEHSEANVAGIFAQIDRINRALGGGEYDVSRPSPARATASDPVFTRRDAQLLDHANEVYRALRRMPAARA
jgi:hypothetical protein